MLSCSSQPSMKFKQPIKATMLKKTFLYLKPSAILFILVINVQNIGVLTLFYEHDKCHTQLS